MKEQKNSFARFVLFTLSRTIGTAADLGIVYVLSRKTGIDNYAFQYILTPTIAFEVATIINFFTSNYWIFPNRNNEKVGSKAFFMRFLKFNLSALMGYSLRLGIIQLLAISGMSVFWCDFIAMTIAGIFNYLIADKWVFKKDSVKAK
ncbi:MAG: GtrA family protein [Bacteroidales bacterium]|nr:GtrA family protein [Bacteroidales bacterium]